MDTGPSQCGPFYLGAVLLASPEEAALRRGCGVAHVARSPEAQAAAVAVAAKALMKALASEEARQQAQAEKLTLLRLEAQRLEMCKRARDAD